MKSELRELGAGVGRGRKTRQYRNTCTCLAHKARERVLGRPLPAAQRGGGKRQAKEMN